MEETKPAKGRTVADMQLDCERAWNRARLYHSELRDIYRYFMPFRQPIVERAPEGGGPTEGASRMDHLFDGTGVSAAANFAGTLQADWMPPHQEFFKLEAGPFLPQGADRAQLNRVLGEVTARVHAVLPRTHVTVHEMLQDLFAGTGAMFLSKGDARRVMNSVAVPPVELALDEGPWGDIWHIYWRRKYRMRDIEEMWPRAEFSTEMTKAIREDRNREALVTQYTYYDTAENIWKLVVWCDADKAGVSFWDEKFQTCPWVIPRMWKAPGEAFGRGLAHLALPSVKTANRGRELALKAAVFAILGLWIRKNDMVFNPDTAVFDAGAMWTVASTGGASGASIARLPVPADFDISSIVMEEERSQIRKLLLDDELPDEQDAVRSATEVAGRLRRYARNRGGTGARLSFELVKPIVERTIDVLYQHGMLPERIVIDDILTKVVITAPAAAAQRTNKVEAFVNWLQMISMLLGPQAVMMVAEVEEALPELGRWLGVDEKLIRSKADIAKLQEMMAAAAQQQAQAEAGPPPPPDPRQYMNGGI